MQEIQSKLPVFKKPPIIERVVSVAADVPQDIYESRIEGWNELVSQAYPCNESIAEWTLEVEERDGIPLLDNIKPILTIKPRFSRKPAKDDFDWSIRSPIGQYTMNLHSYPGEPRNFTDLKKEFLVWLPKWINHFDVKRLNVLDITYLNELSAKITPGFTQETGGIQMDRILKIFSDVPGEHEHLIPPYDCTASVLLKDPEGSALKIRLRNAPGKGYGPRLLLNIQIQTDLTKAGTSLDSISDILDVCHRRIIERFQAIFTEEALASFEPITQ